MELIGGARLIRSTDAVTGPNGCPPSSLHSSAANLDLLERLGGKAVFFPFPLDVPSHPGREVILQRRYSGDGHPRRNPRGAFDSYGVPDFERLLAHRITGLPDRTA